MKLPSLEIKGGCLLAAYFMWFNLPALRSFLSGEERRWWQLGPWENAETWFHQRSSCEHEEKPGLDLGTIFTPNQLFVFYLSPQLVSVLT